MVEGGNDTRAGFSGAPNNLPFNALAFEDLRKASSEAFKAQSESAKKSGAVVDGVATNISGSFKRAAANSAESMDHFWADTEASAARANKTINVYADSTSRMFALHAQAAKKTNEQIIGLGQQTQKALTLSAATSNVSINEMLAAWTAKVTHTDKLISKLNEKSHSLSSSLKGNKKNPFEENLDHVAKLSGSFSHEEIAGQMMARAGANVAVGGLSEITSLLGKIGPTLVELLPAAAAFAGVGAFIAAIAKELWEVDNASAKLANTWGGNRELTDEFIARAGKLTLVAHSSRDNLLELASAFEQANLRMVEGKNDADNYLVTASNMQRVLGLTNSQLAEIANYETAAGRSAKQMNEDYSFLYQTTQELHLTLADFSGSVNLAQESFQSFGAISGSSLAQMTDDVLRVTGLYKGLGLSIKSVGSSLDSLAGDPKKQRKQAIFVSQMLGVSAKSAMNEQFLDPAAFQQDLLKAQGHMLLGNKNAHWELDRDRISGMSTDQVDSIRQNRQMQLHLGAGASGMDQKQIVELLNNFGAFHKNHSGASFDEFMAYRAKEQKGQIGGSLDHAISVFNNSSGELVKSGSEALISIVTNISDGVTALAKTFAGAEFNKTRSGSSSAAASLPLPISVATPSSTSSAMLNSYAAYRQAHGTLPQASARSIASAPSVALDFSPGPNLSNNALDKYRAAQGMKKSRSWHPDMMKHAGIVAQVAAKAGADPATAIATMLQESGGDASVKGDYGYFGTKGKNKHYYFSDPHHKNPNSEYQSGGLFQLFSHGKGAGLTQAQIFDPRFNASRAVGEMKTLRQNHPEWSPGHVAAASQRPADQAGYQRSVDAMYPLAQQILAVLKQHKDIAQSSEQHLVETKEVAKQKAEQQRKIAMVGSTKNTTSQDNLKRAI